MQIDIKSRNIAAAELKTVLSFLPPADEKLARSAGLQIRPINMACGHSNGQVVTRPEIDFYVSDSEKLIKQIRTLNISDIDAEFKIKLNGFASILEVKIRAEYDLNNPQDEFYESIKCLLPLSEEYKRLGLIEKSESLKTHDYWIKKKCLKEFREVMDCRIFSDKFGAQDWNINLPETALKEKWSTAISLLENMKTNPEAEEIFNQVKTHLIISARKALTAKADNSTGMTSIYRQKSTMVIEASLSYISALNWI